MCFIFFNNVIITISEISVMKEVYLVIMTMMITGYVSKCPKLRFNIYYDQREISNLSFNFYSLYYSVSPLS